MDAVEQVKPSQQNLAQEAVPGDAVSPPAESQNGTEAPPPLTHRPRRTWLGWVGRVMYLVSISAVTTAVV